MSEYRPTLLWLRRDLRLADHPALHDAINRGGPVIPVFVLDPETEALGAAHRWRLEASLADLAPRFAALGAPINFRRGDALAALRALAAEVDAQAVVWTRHYDAASIARDTEVKAGLKADGLTAVSRPGLLIREPWEVETKTGGPYRVFTPYWRAVVDTPFPDPLPTPGRIPFVETPPASDTLSDWGMAADMNRGAAVVARQARVGEDAALATLERFLDGPVAQYKAQRDRLDRDGVSALSEPLALGEISPRTIWRRTNLATSKGGSFLRQLIWREFSYHILHLLEGSDSYGSGADWSNFPWRDDQDLADRWRRGETGVDIVDAAMREIYVTGRMHNRARMLVASYLIKHLLIHWKFGMTWFEDVLIDWDVAANTMGWRWVAGSGPDAAPYFRIFNPDTQAEKFDPNAVYRDHWLTGAGAAAFAEAAPRAWNVDPGAPRPTPAIDLKAGRERALAAYAGISKNKTTTEGVLQ